MRYANNACPHSRVELISKEETYSVKGQPITIEAQVPFCVDCKKEVFIPKYDDSNLKKAYDIYRNQHHLLSSEAIIMLRQKYQLSQRAFAILIGCTQATINRYEKGAIPDAAYNTLIRLLEKPENLLTMLEDRRGALDVKDAQKLEEVLERMLNETNHLRDVFSSLSILQLNKPDLFSGFKKFDRNKVVAMTLFFAINQKILYKTKLMKLFWYADMIFFRNYVQSISGMRYAHHHYGPVPEEYELLLGVLKAAKYIDIVADNESGCGEKIIAQVDFDFSCLTQDEIEILEQVNKKFMNVNVTKISNISHEELGYRETKMQELISYEYAESITAM